MVSVRKPRGGFTRSFMTVRLDPGLGVIRKCYATQVCRFCCAGAMVAWDELEHDNDATTNVRSYAASAARPPAGAAQYPDLWPHRRGPDRGGLHVLAEHSPRRALAALGRARHLHYRRRVRFSR